MSWYCVEEINLNGESGIVQVQKRIGDTVVNYPFLIEKDIGVCFKIVSGPHEFRMDAETVRSAIVPNKHLRVVDTDFLEAQVVLQAFIVPK